MADYHFIKINDLAVLSPRELAYAATEQGFPADFWGRANSIHSKIGFEPGVAFLVVPRATMDALNVNEFHSIVWTMNRADVLHTNTHNYWTICDARAVGIDGDEKAAYLLTLVDLRARMQKSKVINRSYNVSTPDDYGTELDDRYWIENTLNSGVLWTWQEILADVWAELPTTAGACPTLPWTPDHSPDTWRFVGVSAWKAVERIFDACQCTIAPQLGGGFYVVDLGVAQPDVFTALTKRLLLDEKLKDAVACTFPEKVAITFLTRAQSCPAVEYHAETPVYKAEPQATGVSGAAVGSERAVRYDLIGDIDDDGTIRNETALDDAATNIALRIAERMGVAADLYKMHSGVCHEVVLGTNTNEVIFRDYGDDTGCVTEAIGHRTGLPAEVRGKPVRMICGDSVKLVELCAQETAERNVPYLCLLGEWDETKLRYCYGAEEVYAIDHRMGAPHAEEGWKGLYQKMPADFTHGEIELTEIYVCVSLDCELPPEGCDCVDEES